MDFFAEVHQLSYRRACQLANVHRSGYYYRSTKIQRDQPVIDALQKLAENHPTYGFRKMFHRLRNEGYEWNHKKVYRVYKALNLNLKRKHKRRLPKRVKTPLNKPEAKNQIWSMDFMSDSLNHGRRFRTLNLIDDYNREVCWLEVGLSMGSQRVVQTLEQVIAQRGKPKKIRVDNGPEFTGHHFTDYCHQNGIEIAYIQPGKPTQNAYIERFNRSYRTEVLDAYLFRTIQEVKQITYKWVEDYNHIRPHESLNNQSPIEFAKSQIMN